MRARFTLVLFSWHQICAEGPLDSAVSQSSMVRSVAIRGTRMPVVLATQVGQPYNAAVIRQDVRRMWSMGRFDDIRAEAAPREDGTGVIFYVRESPMLRLRKLVMEPANLGVRLSLPEGAPLDRRSAQAAAAEARKQLIILGYANAQVNFDLVPIAIHQADLKLSLTPGAKIRVTDVQFAGDTALDSKELHQALRELQIRHIFGWPLFPAYSEEAIHAGLAQLRSFYLSKGYLEARVRLDSTEIHGRDARFRIRVEAGTLRSVKQRPCDLCAALLEARRLAESRGSVDFSATLNVRTDGGLTTAIERGTAYRVGRIEFNGNHHYSDATLRRDFLIQEGQLLDQFLLRKSIDRLNRSKLFEPIDESRVAIHRGDGAGVVDVTVRLTERKRGSWRLSGPVGPASFAGPLQASISSRLPPWGSGIFELATYSASISVFAFAHPILPLLALSPKRPLLPVLVLARPFSPGEAWQSGFSIAPELGWKASALTYPATQVQQRLLPVLAGNRGLIPDLPVTVEGPNGEGVMLCEPPEPRFRTLRYISGMGLRLMGALTGI